MRSWDYQLPLERDGARPVFLQLAHALADDIRRGRLRPGDWLPGSRTLAATIGVNRNTVVAAFRELEAEGWITTVPARGTCVSRRLPDPPAKPFTPRTSMRERVPSRAGYDLLPAPAPEQSPERRPGCLVFGGSAPDLRLIPVDSLARAYRRAVRGRGRDNLGYAGAEGHPRLRAAIAVMLAHARGLVASAESVFITRGSQMALHLIARTLISPGDVVAVESLGYRQAWEAFRHAGARLVPVPVDDQGVDVSTLARLTAAGRIRALYLTPHHQFPTTVTLSPGRRLELLALAREHRFAIVEDDYDHEFHYEGRPVLPLASVDRAGVVIYVGTLSKVLAPGLRIGYVVAPRPLLERMAAHRAVVDMQGDLAVECAVAELLEDGEVQRHVRRARRLYMERRGFLIDALDREVGNALLFDRPAGGIALWGSAADGIDIDAWLERALTHGVTFQTARYFSFDRRPRNGARFGFAALDESEIREAARRLGRALHELR